MQLSAEGPMDKSWSRLHRLAVHYQLPYFSLSSLIEKGLPRLSPSMSVSVEFRVARRSRLYLTPQNGSSSLLSFIQELSCELQSIDLN